jgi:hypothetical protein
MDDVGNMTRERREEGPSLIVYRVRATQAQFASEK